MDFNLRHRELIAAVNNAKRQWEHDSADAFLRGWRAGHEEALDGRLRYDWTDADLQFEGTPDFDRPMTLGVFHDWMPEE